MTNGEDDVRKKDMCSSRVTRKGAQDARGERGGEEGGRGEGGGGGGFFFQAEDGIRDRLVTGVQTCALPICHRGKYPHHNSPVQ